MMVQNSDAAQLDDRHLVNLARKGDLAAFEELVRRYQPKVYQLVYRMVGDPDDAADLAQDTFLRAFLGLSRFRGKSSFYTWVYRIAVNQTLNFLKKKRLRAAPSMDDTEMGVERSQEYLEQATVRTPDKEVAVSELGNRLNAALAKLSDKHRTVVVLHDIQGVPHDEIARMLRCSPGTVRSRLFYARKQLQKELAEFLP